MQSLEVISVNLWQILISLCNLLILFLILKRFLFKPVKKMLAKRENSLNEQYSRADKAVSDAEALKSEWDEKIKSADDTADLIIKKASDTAEKSKKVIINEAYDKANSIIRRAEDDAELEKKKAQSEIKKEIVDVSAKLSEAILDREISIDDHRNLIDDFLNEIGENNGGSK